MYEFILNTTRTKIRNQQMIHMKWQALFSIEIKMCCPLQSRGTLSPGKNEITSMRTAMNE